MNGEWTMGQRTRIIIALLIATLITISGGCGATRPRAPTPQSPAPVAPTAASTSTPAPTPNASQGATATAQRATEQASPNWEPGLGGMLYDFFLAVLAGNDAKARGYLVPGFSASVTDLRQAFGLPTPRASPGGHLTFDNHLLADEGDRLLVETAVLFADGPTVRERVTLTRDATDWKIAAVVPVG